MPAPRAGRMVAAGCTLLVVAVLMLYVVDQVFPTGIRNTIRRAAVDAGYGVHGSETSLRSALAMLPERLLTNVINGPDLPQLVIDINFRNLSKLYAKRNEALDLGYLVQAEDDFVPATIRLENRTVDVKLRLKGDMVDHVRTSKWSFRIHAKGDDHIFGLRRFSLQHPETRGFQAEVMFLETLRRMGVLAPRYFFVNVVVNGNDVGLMALEEHFSSELLESSGRRDGIILRFDESLMWADRVARGRDAVRYTGPFDDIYNAPIEAFRSSAIEESERLKREYAVAAGLLRAFVEDEMPAANVFDVDKLGQFLAAAELWGVWHALGWNNQRFYLNPLTMRLEPIGYDGHLEGAIGSESINSPGSLPHRMLQDPEIYAAFEYYVRELKHEVENGELIQYFEQLQKRALRELRTEFTLLEEIDLSDLRARAGQLPYPPMPSEPEPPGTFGAYVIAQTINKDGKRYLELSNPLPHDVEVVAIDWMGPEGAVATLKLAKPLEYPIDLSPKPSGQRRTPILIECPYPDDSNELWLRVSSRLKGSTDVKTINARPGALPLKTNPMPEGDLEAALALNPFLLLSPDGGAVEAIPGQWTISGSLVIPRGLEFQIPAGTTLLFAQGASLIVYGPTSFLGTDSDPIILDAKPGQDGVWQGIVVHEANERSVWENVMVSNTSGVRWSAWEMTGGVTFYRSDVSMMNCRFARNLAEDALNIVHSDFELNEVQFEDTASDGLDSDFSTGSIRGGSFSKIGAARGADGADFSGSRVSINGTRFSGITDKAISVGEKSTVTAVDIKIENSGAGAVSKDGSSLHIRSAVIRGTTIAALMSYVKKPEFGGASLVAEQLTISDATKPAWVQHGNILEIDGERLSSEDMDVDALYRSSMQRRGRK